MENQELRAYFFQNMYLQGIHAGIQTQHCTAEMFVKYLPFENRCSDMLYDWANHHKTTIILNGGYASNLHRIVDLLTSPDNPYPWAYFCESEEALEGCITNVGVIVPKTVYDYVSEQEKLTKESGLVFVSVKHVWGLSDFQVELAREISKCHLMR
jgi:hypothetical protein